MNIEVSNDSGTSGEILLSVIIPAYNEEKRLPATLADLHSKLVQSNFTYEILVVNDGSTDQTAAMVEKAQLHIEGLRLIDDGVHRGKGGAVRQGMLAGKGSWRIFMDADNSTSIDQFEEMAPFLQQGYDVAIGSRALKDSVLSPAEPWYRQAAGKAGNLFIQALVLPGIWDTQCGFKAFSAQAAQDIFSSSTVDGWAFDVEILAIAKKRGLKIKEVPIRWANNALSHVRTSTYFAFLWDVVKIHRRFF